MLIKLILNSYAKLNLYLVVSNKRKDGYHNIRTLFERIDLADKIIIKSRRDNKINVICKAQGLPKDNSKNLAWLAAKLLQDSFNINRGADIKIIKRIPVGAGLGGGSSNAATVLLGLNKLWKLNLKTSKLAALAGKIGSDVAFFVYNAPFAIGRGRGERIQPLKALGDVKLWHVLAVPRIKVSTPVIYKGWDRLNKAAKISKIPGLTRPVYDVKILLSALKRNDTSLINKSLFNCLEQVTTKAYPEVLQLKEALLDLRLKSILMSGSGPAVFAIVSSKKKALASSRRLQGKNRFWQIFVTRTH